MAKSYTVTAPLAIVRNSQQGGRQEYLYQGSVLPSYVDAEELKRLLDGDLVAETSQAESDGVTPITSPDQLVTSVLVPPATGSGTSTPAPVRTMSAGDDPADYNVGEVQTYLATASDDEKARVLAAEADGKKRASLLQ